MNFRGLSIGNRLRSGLGIITAFMVILTVTGIGSLSAMNDKLKQITEVNDRKIELAQSINDSSGGIDKSMLTIALQNNDEVTKAERKKVEDARAALQASLSNLEKVENTAKGKEIISAIKDNFGIETNAHDKALELIASGNAMNGKTMIAASSDISRMLSESSEEMVKYQREKAAAHAKEARATYVRARYLLLSLGAAIFGITIFLTSFLARSITKPLGEGVSVARKIAEGDLTALIETTANDETGQLLRAMRNMVENLQRIIGEVKVAAGDMASASQQLNASSELMSKGAGEQAGKASQVAAASQEMSQTIMDVAKNTSGIETSATDTAKLARDGEAVVERSVEKVKAIAKTVAESAQLIKLLGDRSNQIGAIINVINEIADQTNLLALNAAIEAARAGDAGRGFAVVADEVRKLAERTASSTSEIGGMIKAIQTEVRQAVLSMENITNEVKSGVDLSGQTGDVLRGIVEAVDQLRLMVQQIASATEEMATTSDEINRDIESIAAVSRETSGSSEHIAGASEELAKLSVGLEKAVSGFKV
jgi:methyl-accepting chemotaxis protein